MYFTNKCTHLLKTKQNKTKITSTKIKLWPQFFFAEWFGHKEIEHEKSAQNDFSKGMWVLISKGLQHLNTALFKESPDLNNVTYIFLGTVNIIMYIFKNFKVIKLWRNQFINKMLT